MRYAIPLIVIMMTQLPSGHAQRVEAGTGYWDNGIVTHNGSTAKVMSNDPRPLQRAVESLSEEYGWIIDYEDPVYSDSETVDRTDNRWIASHPGVRQRVVGGHRFESEFPEIRKIGPSTTDEKNALEKVVADFNKSGNPGQFTLIDEGAGRFAVVGKTNGAAKTILDTSISFKTTQLNDAFALEAFSHALSASSGITVTVLTYPLNLFVQTEFIKTIANQRAREVLRDLVDNTDRKIEWTLLYDIDDKAYYLNLIGVVKATTDNTGIKTIEEVR